MMASDITYIRDVQMQQLFPSHLVSLVNSTDSRSTSLDSVILQNKSRDNRARPPSSWEGELMTLLVSQSQSHHQGQGVMGRYRQVPTFPTPQRSRAQSPIWSQGQTSLQSVILLSKG